MPNARPPPGRRVDDAALNDGPRAAVTAHGVGRRKQQIHGISAAAPPHQHEKSSQLLSWYKWQVRHEFNVLNKMFNCSGRKAAGRIGNQKLGLA